MSGGSYEYLSSRLESGDLERVESYAKQAHDDLERLLEMLAKGEVTEWDHKTASHVPSFTPTQVARVEMGVALALRHWDHAVADLTALQARLRALADVLHALEWWCSGDTGPDYAAKACVEYMETRIGLEPGSLLKKEPG